MNPHTPASIDEYINNLPDNAKPPMQLIRTTIRTALPNATEAISYGIPTFKIEGKNVVHFAAYKNHIGFYATPDGHNEFETDLSLYKRGRGSVQFPINKPMPLDLITRISTYRSKQLGKKE